MKTAKLLMGAVLCTSLIATAALGQSQSQTRRGVSPVYIPGIDVPETRAEQPRRFTPAQPAKATRSEPSATRLPSKSIVSSATNSSSSSSDSSVGAIDYFNQGCDCGSGGCDCGSGGCDCGGSYEVGCDSCSSGGCLNRRDRVGRSFFSRLRARSPIKVNFVSADEGCGCDDCCGGGQCCNRRRGLARFIPTVRIRTNACNRYRAVFGGWVDLEDYDGENGAGLNRLVDFNDGWAIGFTRGRRFPCGIRLESETTFRHNTVGEYSVGNFVGMDFVPVATFAAQDDIYSISNMNNLLKDFRGFGKFIPYVGVGVGTIYVDGDIMVPALGRTDYIQDGAFAYQFIAGLSRVISSRTEAYAEFRHLGTSGVDIETDMGPVIDDEFDYQNNNLFFGLRFTIPNSAGT